MATIIDGNNYIKRHPADFNRNNKPEIADTDMDVARRKFINMLRDFARRVQETVGKHSNITVVFDGCGYNRDGKGSNIRVLHGNGKSADDVIKESLRSGAKGIKLVSDDNELRDFVIRKGGIALTCASFRGKLMSVLGRGQTIFPEGQKYDGKISDEERNYWMREFGVK